MALIPPVVAELKANIGEFVTKMGEAKEHVEKLGAAGESSSKRLKEGLAKGLEGAGAAATGADAVLLEFGEKQEVAQKSLENSIRSTGKAYDDYSKQIDSSVGHMEKFGHTQDDTKNALAKLTTALQDPKKALDQMGLVADIAARKHESLTAASAQVVKMTQGATKAYKEFGVIVDKAPNWAKEIAKAQASEEKAGTSLLDAKKKLADLEAKQHEKAHLTVEDHQRLEEAYGKVAAASEVSAEKQKELAFVMEGSKHAGHEYDDQMKEVARRLSGEAASAADTFGGKLNALKAKAEDMAGSLGSKLGPALTVAGPLLMGLGAIIESSVIPAILSATVAAAPWILAIAAVGAAAYLLYRNWDTVWSAIKTAVSDAVKFVNDHLTLILTVALGPLGLEIGILKDHWSTVWGAVHTAISDAWRIMEPIFGFIKRAIDDIAGPLGKVLGAVSKVGGVVGGALKHIPGFAGGVDDFAGGLALVGERGPEIVNLPRGSSVTPNNRLGGGGVTINLTLHGLVGNDRAVIQKIRDGLMQIGKSNGTIFGQFA